MLRNGNKGLGCKKAIQSALRICEKKLRFVMKFEGGQKLPKLNSVEKEADWKNTIT